MTFPSTWMASSTSCTRPAGRCAGCRGSGRGPRSSHQEPVAVDVKGSYADPTAEAKTEKEYSWSHSLGEIVTALALAGLPIEFLHEWPFVDWEVPFLEKRDGRWWLPGRLHGRCP